MSRSPFSRTKRLFVAIVSAAMLAVSFTAVASADVKVEPGVNSGPVDPNETRADAAQCKQYKTWYTQDQKSGTSTNPNYYKDLAAKRGLQLGTARRRRAHEASGDNHHGARRHQPRPGND